VNRTLISAGSNWLAFAFAVAASFFVTPLLIGGLGPARYDVWCIAEAVLAYFTLLEAGIGPGLLRAVAGRKNIDITLSASLVAYALAGAVALLFGAPVMLLLAPALEPRGGPETPYFLLLLLFNLALSLPLSVFATVLEGLECYPARSAVRILFLLVRSVGSLLAVPWGLTALGGVFLLATLLEHILYYLLVRRNLPGLKLQLFAVRKSDVVQQWSTGRDAFLAMFAGRLAGQTGAIVVGLCLPAGSATAFATALRLLDYARTALRTLTATLTPGIARLDASGDREGIRRLFLQATRWVLYLGLPVQIGLLFFGEPFLVRWLGPEIAAASTVPLLILSSTLGLTVAQSAASRVLYGLGVLRTFARLALFEGIAAVALTALLAGPFGLQGAAWAAALPHGVFCVAVIGITMKRLEIEIGKYAKIIARPLVAVLVPTGVWCILPTPTAHYGQMAVTVLAGLLFDAVIVALFESDLFRRGVQADAVQENAEEPIRVRGQLQGQGERQIPAA
jgi:O-antigen/teichoic acid export membrane protein